METSSESAPPAPPPSSYASYPSQYSRREMLGSRQQVALLNSGLLFMFISLCCFGGIIWWLIQIGGMSSYTPERGGSELMWYVGGYLPALILFVSAIVCAMVGYSLLNAAGASTKEVIPRQDYELLSALVSEEKEKAIDLYVRLNSLSDLTGFFTKIGISGLPLATIALSLVFTVLGLFSGGTSKLYDLANLTLGAFLGSYVQRQVSSSGRPPRNANEVPPAAGG